MEIPWRHDIDRVLSDARTRPKPVLLEYSTWAKKASIWKH